MEFENDLYNLLLFLYHYYHDLKIYVPNTVHIPRPQLSESFLRGYNFLSTRHLLQLHELKPEVSCALACLLLVEFIFNVRPVYKYTSHQKFDKNISNVYFLRVNFVNTIKLKILSTTALVKWCLSD